ncbi:MAG TPA: hypothetical protein VGM67_07205 [Gemmatimonadaceae bacterium]|jgi:hypothetical protein
MRTLDLLGHFADDDRAGGIRKLGELAEMVVHHPARAGPLERNTDEQGALDRRDDVDRIVAYMKILFI